MPPTPSAEHQPHRSIQFSYRRRNRIGLGKMCEKTETRLRILPRTRTTLPYSLWVMNRLAAFFESAPRRDCYCLAHFAAGGLSGWGGGPVPTKRKTPFCYWEPGRPPLHLRPPPPLLPPPP